MERQLGVDVDKVVLALTLVVVKTLMWRREKKQPIARVLFIGRVLLSHTAATARTRLLVSERSKCNPIISPSNSSTSIKSYTRLSENSHRHNLRNIKSNGTVLLTLEGCKEDINGLVGRGQALLEKGEWEDAVTALEKAFGSGDREVIYPKFQSEHVRILISFFWEDIAKTSKGEEVVETE